MKKEKLTPFAEGNLSERVKNEWMMKEEGSWEDAGKPEGDINNMHVYIILATSPKGKYRCINRHSAEVLLQSASYHDGAWDRDEKIVIDLMNTAGRISRELNSILKYLNAGEIERKYVA